MYFIVIHRPKWAVSSKNIIEWTPYNVNTKIKTNKLINFPLADVFSSDGVIFTATVSPFCPSGHTISITLAQTESLLIVLGTTASTTPATRLSTGSCPVRILLGYIYIDTVISGTDCSKTVSDHRPNLW